MHFVDRRAFLRRIAASYLAAMPLLAALAVAAMPGCNGSGSSSGIGNSAASGGADANSSSARRKFPLNTLPTTTISVNGKTIRVWLALSPAEQEEGLMFVPENEIADDQGMLFVFPDEKYHAFWMKNTITSLDIAFIKSNGIVVNTYTMPPLTEDTFPSLEPVMFVLEMKAGAFTPFGIKQNSTFVLPQDLFKTSP